MRATAGADGVTSAAELVPDESSDADERLIHRGPFNAMLVRPEVGALLGGALVWAFFWAATEKFGTAAGAANYLDVAAPLGIMAVAVSLLMIGGEFDLSAGVLTGSTAILMGLIAAEAGDAGVSLYVAVPIALAGAIAIGWCNGQLVNRTSLPSFIVTLGTFFVLRGANLGFTKMVTGRVIVEDIDEASGFSSLRVLFASEFRRGEFGLRDPLFTTLVILGTALGAFGLLELVFRRRPALDRAGAVLAILGLVVAAGSFAGLLRTDGLAQNWTFGLILGVGIVLAVTGVGQWRYRRAALGDDQPDTGWGGTLGPATAGVALLVCGAAVAMVLDASSERTIGVLLTEQGLRAIAYVGLTAAGLIAIGLAARRGAELHRGRRFALLALLAGAVAACGFVIRSESDSKKFRAELLTTLLLVAVAILAAAVVEFRHAKRVTGDADSDRLGRRMIAVGVALMLSGLAVRLMFSDITLRISIFWWLLITAVASVVLFRTQLGNWIFAVGGNKESARSVGVPAHRIKTGLFITTAVAAWLTGMIIAFRLKSVQANQGVGEEFEYIIAAVVGGTLLTGGYGSAVGAAVGALIIGMSLIGIPFAGWNTDWRYLFLGVILLAAVLVNNLVRGKAQRARR
jgi:ribose/xylose/arabinose/galactoside ABC-type transport system permease subunit